MSLTGIRRFPALCGAILLAASSGVVADQVPRAGLNLHLDTFEADYSRVATPFGGVVLRGEPFILDVTLVSKERGLPVAAEVDWPRRIRLAVSKGSFHNHGAPMLDLPCDDRSVPLREGRTELRGDLIVFSTPRSQTVQCRMTLDELNLPAGLYVLTAQWTDATSHIELKPSRSSQRLVALEFEVRDVRTQEDALDLDLHLGWRALVDERSPAKASKLAERVLEADAFSIPALTLRARAASMLGQCQQARRDLIRAAGVVRTGADRRPRLALKSAAARERTAGELEQSANRLNCR